MCFPGSLQLIQFCPFLLFVAPPNSFFQEIKKSQEIFLVSMLHIFH